MNGLRNAQRQYDRRLPDEGRQRAEREFEFAHPESAPVGASVIRSSKVIQMNKPIETQRDELLAALQQIMRVAEQSQFQAVSLMVLRQIAGPVIQQAQGESK